MAAFSSSFEAHVHYGCLLLFGYGVAEALVALLFILFTRAAKIFAEMRDVDRLSAVLRGGDRSDYLRDYCARDLERFGAFYHLAVHDGAVIEHVADVDEAAVEYGLQKIVGIVEVNGAFVVSLGDVFGQEYPAGKVLGNFAGDEVALGGRRAGVLVGVLLHYVLVGIFDERKNALVRGVGFADERTLVAVEDIGLHELVLLQLHQLFLDHVLNIFDQQP